MKPAFNLTYPELGNRTTDCELGAVGKPVFYHYLDKVDYGSWLRDPYVKENITSKKIYVTRDNEPMALYEYNDRSDHRLNKPSRNMPYKLTCAFKGNAHIVFNNHFYYFCADGPKIVKYDLTLGKPASKCGALIKLQSDNFFNPQQ